jgi:hypothetical protein
MRLATVTCLLASSFFAGLAFAQAPNMNDFECRNAITEALPSLRHASDNRLDVFSLVIRMDTTEQTGSRTRNFTSYISYYDDLAINTEIVQAEMLNYVRNPVNGQDILLQRIAADGKKVWSYDAERNEYAVQNYSGEIAAQRSNRYRPDFFNLFRAPVKGQPLDMITLLDQAVGDVPRARNWVGIASFAGYDTNDPVAPTREVWQQTPDGTRYVKFYMSRVDSIWQIDSIELRRQQQIGSEQRVVTSVIRVVQQDGLPLLMTRNEGRFFFTPPAGSKVIASPRTITF